MVNNAFVATLILSFLSAPAFAAEDPVARAETVLKQWRNSEPSCKDFAAVSPPNGINLDRANAGAPVPEYKSLGTGSRFLSMCDLFLVPMVVEGIFSAEPFCTRIGENAARCTLMTPTSQPYALIFKLAPKHPKGVVLEAIGWQRKTQKTLPPEDDDDDLPT